MITFGNLDIENICLGTEQIESVFEGTVEIWRLNENINPTRYIKFTSTEGNITLGLTSFNEDPELIPEDPDEQIYESPREVNLYYSYDNDTWRRWDYSVPLEIMEGENLYLAGYNPHGFNIDRYKGWQFTMTGTGVLDCESGINGDIMSLINYDEEVTVIPSPYCFNRLFKDCTRLQNLPYLSATTLSEGCYKDMFNGCTMVNPVILLPASTLTPECYSGMFSGCTGLQHAPDLHYITTLAYRCCYEMFKDCTGLTSAPDLYARTVNEDAYVRMFYGCNNISNVFAIFENDYDRSALTDWLYYVSANGTFTKLSGVTIPRGDSGIPFGWDVIEYLPPDEDDSNLNINPGDSNTPSSGSGGGNSGNDNNEDPGVDEDPIEDNSGDVENGDDPNIVPEGNNNDEGDDSDTPIADDPGVIEDGDDPNISPDDSGTGIPDDNGEETMDDEGDDIGDGEGTVVKPTP